MGSIDNIRVYSSGVNSLKKSVHVRVGWFNSSDTYIIRTDDCENTISFRRASMFYVGKAHKMCDCNHNGWLSTGISSYIPRGVYELIEGDEDYVKFKLMS